MSTLSKCAPEVSPVKTVAPEVYVIGAGPGGLAAAAALTMQDISVVVLEKTDDVASTWRNHYDRLHLHTHRLLSGLPGLGIPPQYGDYVSRDHVVAYLEQYAAHHDLDIRTGVEVTDIVRDLDGWQLTTADDDKLVAPSVVVATGYNNTPMFRVFPGFENFTGEIVHASKYKNGEPYRGKNVLVVGPGNTGAEIATDLHEHGAAAVSLAVRTVPHIVRRSYSKFWPTTATGILIRHLPAQVVDPIAKAATVLTMPNLTKQGLPRPTTGLTERVRQGAIPIMDVGIINAIRSGAVKPVAALESFDNDRVVLSDGTTLTPDVVLFATGYVRNLESLLGNLDVLDQEGNPRVNGSKTLPHAPNLYFTGFTNPISGMFRELRLDAYRIAKAVEKQHSAM